MRARLCMLSNDELYQIHLASLDILERTGMVMGSDIGLKLMKEAGAEVDEKSRLVKIPSSLVKWAIKSAPERILLCGRNPKNDIKLEDGRVYFGMGSTTLKFMDVGGKRYPARKEFIEKAVRVGDALPNIKFMEQFCCALDYKGPAQSLHEIEAVLTNTEKPTVGIAYSPEETRAAIKIASLIVGGMDELRRRPILALYSEPVSPLQHDKAYVENLIEFAKAGLPVTYGPCMNAGSTGPITVAGTLACSNAETLSGLVISQLVNKGTPYIIGNISTAFDQRTGIMAYGAPEFGLINAGQAASAQYYKIPFFGTGGTTDAKEIDGQALAECSLTALMAVLSGTNLIHDCGYLESGMTASIEMLVVCDEVADMCFRLARGMEVSDETLATDVINKVGPGGHFLAEKHSLKHIDEVWIPTLMDRNRMDQWVASGSKDLVDRAREKAKKILKEHQPEPIPPDIQREIDKILKEVERGNF